MDVPELRGRRARAEDNGGAPPVSLMHVMDGVLSRVRRPLGVGIINNTWNKASQRLATHRWG